MLNALLNKRKNQVKEKIEDNYSLATQITYFIGLSLAGKELPSLSDLYPSLFKAPNKDEEAFIKFKELADAVNNNRKVNNNESGNTNSQTNS